MKKLKKLLALLTVLLLVSATLPFVSAEDGTTYSYTLKCSLTDETTVKAELYVSGGKLQAGGFGFGFHNTVVQSVTFAYTATNVYSLSSAISTVETTETSSFTVVSDTWVYENHSDPVYIDATNDAVKLGEFTITINEGTTLTSDSITVSDPGDGFNEKFHSDGNYYVMTYNSDLDVGRYAITSEIEIPQSTVTLKTNYFDTKAYATISGMPGTVLTLPGLPAIDGYTSHFWSEDGRTQYSETAFPDSDVTLYGIYEYITENEYLYTLEAQVIDEKVVARLYYKGAAAQSGTFGIAYDINDVTLDSFVLADASVGATLIGGDTNFCNGIESENDDGIYYNRWIYQGSETSTDQVIYIDGSTGRVLVGTFTFSVVDGGTLGADSIYHSSEYPETAKAYVDGNFVVSPYYNNATVEHVAIDFAPIVFIPYTEATETFSFAVTTSNVEVGKLYNIESTDDFPGYSSAAKWSITDSTGAEIASGTQKDFGDISFDIDLTLGTEYSLVIVKNGYLTCTYEFTSEDSATYIEIEMIGGDIKGAHADECGDGKVDIFDFIRVVRGFNKDATIHYTSAVDINEDGNVNIDDLIIVKRNFGKKVTTE